MRRPPTDLNEKLKLVRRLTGDKFSAARGYDARKPISKARARTINKYWEIAQELLSRPHQLVTPPKGGKREAFAYTGQARAPRFAKAIVSTPQPEDPYSFGLTKTRPRGSRFTVTNRRTGEASWHIPEDAFADAWDIDDDDEEGLREYYADVLSEYASDYGAQVFMIEAGEAHMWGSAGGPDLVAAKLVQLRRNYDATKFDPSDKNSHWIGNWFRGVTVFSPGSVGSYIRERRAQAAQRQETWGLRPHEHWRPLKSGDIARFYQGKVVDVVPLAFFEKMIATRQYGLIRPKDDDE